MHSDGLTNLIIIVKFVKRHTRSYRGASGGVNQAA